MIKDMIVSSTALETRVAILEDDQLAELYIERQRNRGILANIYKGKVTKVLPGMQSAFVNVGLEKDAFLYVSDFVEENEEIDTVLPIVEEPPESVIMEAEAQERPSRKERRGDKNRWKEKKERAEAARAQNVESSEAPSHLPEIQDEPEVLSPETDRLSEDAGNDHVALPAPFDFIPETLDGGTIAGEEISSERAVEEALSVPEETETGFTEPVDAPESPLVPETPASPEKTGETPGIVEVTESEHSAPEEAEAVFAEPAPVPESPLVLETPASPEKTEETPDVVEVTENEPPALEEAETVFMEPVTVPEPLFVLEAPASLEKTDEQTDSIEIPENLPDDAAVIRDDGNTAPFAAEENFKAGFSRRRGGVATRRKRYTAARHTHKTEHQSIDDVLHEGQEVLVQVAKEPIGKKGARVTSHIALPGRYLVYMPTVDHVGVSRKIGSDAERMRLKEIILRHRDRFPGGVIVRTAAEEHSEEDLCNDLRFLVRIWEDMRNRAERVSAPAMIHAEMSLVQRLLRDQFSFEFATIRVDDELEYQQIVEFVDKIYPNLVHRVKLHTKDSDIFDEYGITPEIDKLLQPKIWLKSGGYIVINQTEALVSIDINTGKFVGRGNSLEETITRTNLEAVKEIVRQIRLRDLGGIIVIDFIDMDERKNRKRVMEALSEEIARDKAPSKILEFNEFGLVAITRKRVKQSLERTLCQSCPYCSGSGMVKSVATTCYGIYHEIEKMRSLIDDRMEITVRVHPEVAKALRETESGVINELRHILRKDIIVKSDPALHIEHFNVVTG